MSQYGFTPGTFLETVNGKARPKRTMWIIMIAVGVLVLSIVGGVIGTRSAKDENCQCRKKTDAGWMGFSITYFILTVVAFIILLVLTLRKKTRGAAASPARSLFT
jgi:hypothetical protein